MNGCYAESDDGVHWTRPNLGMIEFAGSKQNNNIWPSDKPGEFGTPAETIDFRKQAKLRATALYYLQKNRRASKKPCRFDIVAVTGARTSERVQWLQNAFECQW